MIVCVIGHTEVVLDNDNQKIIQLITKNATGIIYFC